MVEASTAERTPQRGPIRMCVGCRERADRSVLLRVVAAEVDGTWSVVPDPGHRQSGRGASLHPEVACLDLAERRRAFTRALRSEVPLAPGPVRRYLETGRVNHHSTTNS